MDEIPVLGFMQPAKPYLQARNGVVLSTASETVEHYTSRHPYHDNESVSCEMRYDRKGRLTRLSADDNIFTFGNFQPLSNGAWIPKQVQWAKNSSVNINGKDCPITINIITYNATAIDTKLPAPNLFGFQGISKDSQVLDQRYHLVGQSAGINYLYDGNGSIDEASQKILTTQQIAHGDKKRVSNLSLTVRIICFVIMFLLLLHITRLLRNNPSKESF